MFSLFWKGVPVTAQWWSEREGGEKCEREAGEEGRREEQGIGEEGVGRDGRERGRQGGRGEEEGEGEGDLYIKLVVTYAPVTASYMKCSQETEF